MYAVPQIFENALNLCPLFLLCLQLVVLFLHLKYNNQEMKVKKVGTSSSMND